MRIGVINIFGGFGGLVGLERIGEKVFLILIYFLELRRTIAIVMMVLLFIFIGFFRSFIIRWDFC